MGDLKFRRKFFLVFAIFISLFILGAGGILAKQQEEPEVKLVVDDIAPSVPMITTNPTYVEDSWTNKATVATATGATDDVTPEADLIYEVSTDGTTFNIGNSITLDQSGNYTVYFKVTDEAGNSSIANKNIKIDLIAPGAPYITMTAGSLGYVANTWTNKEVKINLYGAADTGGSDIAAYQYKIGDGAWKDGTTYTFKISGEYVLYFRTVDNAGNVSATSQRNIKVDLEGPKAFTIKTNISTIDSIYISGSTVDALSGMNPLGYRVFDGNKWSAWRSTIDDWLTGYDRGESVLIKVEARDKAGNITLSQITVKTLANTAPVAVKDSFSMKEDAEETILDVLKNDYDDDNGDKIKVVAVSELSDLVAGTVLLDNGEVTFKPAKDYFGNVNFTYTIQDEYGGKSTGVVELTVRAVEDIVEEPVEEDKNIFGEPIFSDICIAGWVVGSLLLLINYIIHREFFNRKIIRIIGYILISALVFFLLCVLRISLGYGFSLSIMVVYIVTCYIYAATGKVKKTKSKH